MPKPRSQRALFNGEQELRRAVGMVRAADKLLRQSFGELLLEQRWKPGEIMDVRTRKVRELSDTLANVRKELDELLHE